jgi:hypothetical protein
VTHHRRCWRAARLVWHLCGLGDERAPHHQPSTNGRATLAGGECILYQQSGRNMAKGGEPKAASTAGMDWWCKSFGPGSAAALVDNIATCCTTGWKANKEEMMDLVSMAGEGTQRGRSGRLRCETAPRHHGCMLGLNSQTNNFESFSPSSLSLLLSR